VLVMEEKVGFWVRLEDSFRASMNRLTWSARDALAIYGNLDGLL
jgi:hypothetical protein